MSEGIINGFLLGVVLWLICDISQLKEEVRRSNRALNKLINHFGIEAYKNIDDELRDTIANEGKIKAIKIYREHTGLGLKESKEYIDNLDLK
ncbi:MAG: 50S ribosomal protein L7/L12 [Clostridium sartagoforme]|nr:50S ribosomal protein L7/L12 [Clostridium sartagoforme]